MTLFLLTILWFVLGLLAFQLLWSVNLNNVNAPDVWHVLAGPILLITVVVFLIQAANRAKQDPERDDKK